MSSAVMSQSIWYGSGVQKVKPLIQQLVKIQFDMVAAFELKTEKLQSLYINKKTARCRILSLAPMMTQLKLLISLSFLVL